MIESHKEELRSILNWLSEWWKEKFDEEPTTEVLTSFYLFAVVESLRITKKFLTDDASEVMVYADENFFFSNPFDGERIGLRLFRNKNVEREKPLKEETVSLLTEIMSDFDKEEMNDFEIQGYISSFPNIFLRKYGLLKKDRYAYGKRDYQQLPVNLDRYFLRVITDKPVEGVSSKKNREETAAWGVVFHALYSVLCLSLAFFGWTLLTYFAFIPQAMIIKKRVWWMPSWAEQTKLMIAAGTIFSIWFIQPILMIGVVSVVLCYIILSEINQIR